MPASSLVDKPIVIGYDWSSGGRRALVWALREGGYQRRPVRVIHAVPDDAAGDLAKLTVRLAQVAAEATHWGRVNVTTTSEVVSGRPGEVISEESRYAEMVVVGAAHGAADAPWAQVWTKAGCPVAVVQGRLRIPDRRPVIAVLDGMASDAAAHAVAMWEANVRDVDMSVQVPMTDADLEFIVAEAQLVVVSAGPGDGPLAQYRRALLDGGCPVLIVPPGYRPAVRVRPSSAVVSRPRVAATARC